MNETHVRHVLFVTYYFPPSGGSGVQRSLKFVKYLPEMNWKVTVLTVLPEFAAFPDLDPALLDEVPSEVTVVKTRSWDPYSVYARLMGKKKSEAVGVGFLGANHTSFKEKAARWVRANVFLPDARIGWVGYARKAGLSIIKEQLVDAIVSTGPPHSSHLIASYLSAEGQIPWIADIRDAWPDMAYADMLPTSRFAQKRDAAIRNKALSKAAKCVAVTEALKDTMERTTGRTFTLIRNGFDPADMEGLVPKESSVFTIVHTGNMAPARNPEPIWTILVDKRRKEQWDDVVVQCVGNVDASIMFDVDRLQLSDRVNCISYVPHAEALRYTMGACLLLLPINRVNDAAGIVTGKIYEYIASGRPIVGLGDPHGEAAALLTETGAGKMFAYEDVRGVEACITEHYEAWLAGSPLQGANQQRAAAFSRRSQTEQLATLLNEITS